MLKLFFYTLLVFFQLPIIQDISKNDVLDLLEDKSIDIIDLRTDEEFSKGSIKSVSYTHLTLPTSRSV